MNDKEKIKLCIENIEKTISNNVSSNETTLVQFLTTLLQECTREIRKLLLEDIDLSSLSLCVRNIFELHLIFQHLCADENALKNWRGQFYKDLKDVNDGFITLGNMNGLDTSELENEQEHHNSTLDTEELILCRDFKMRDLAEKYGSLEDYKAVHKLCSKLIHPSSMRVNAISNQTENAVFFDLLFLVGMHFASKIEKFSKNRLASANH